MRAEAEDKSARVERIDGVALEDLTDAEQELWIDLVNSALSPCGDPSSVARCASVPNGCVACLMAAKYLQRLVMEGYDETTIEEHYAGRFGAAKGVAPATADAPARGPGNAPVTVVVFSDFECPHCGQAHPLLVRLLATHADRVRLVFKHFPLMGHPRALPAARAAEAARRQGRFWEMHDRLFEHQRSLEDADLERYAADVGLDLEKYRADVASSETDARIESDQAEGMRLGIEGTPAFFVGGRRFREPLRALDAYVAEEPAR